MPQHGTRTHGWALVMSLPANRTIGEHSKAIYRRFNDVDDALTAKQLFMHLYPRGSARVVPGHHSPSAKENQQ